MIYISAGLYAEGRSDYDFLLPLIDRLLAELGARLFPAASEIADTRGIDAPSGMTGGRALRICAAITQYIHYCDVFIIHSDGAGDADEARRTQINPGMDLARGAFSSRRIHLVACVPVREIEAWMLVDLKPFELALGKNIQLELPSQPEAELDPKNLLRKIFREGDAHFALKDAYPLFGMTVRLENLRALPAFRAFEQDLSEVLKMVGAVQGWRPTT